MRLFLFSSHRFKHSLLFISWGQWVKLVCALAQECGRLRLFDEKCHIRRVTLCCVCAFNVSFRVLCVLSVCHVGCRLCFRRVMLCPVYAFDVSCCVPIMFSTCHAVSCLCFQRVLMCSNCDLGVSCLPMWCIYNAASNSWVSCIFRQKKC